jgi:hypothetical protein
MKPSSNLKSVVKHAAVWIIWYCANSLTLLSVDFSSLSIAGWLHLAFNYISLIVVFYAVANIMQQMFNRISFVKYQNLKGLAAIRYLLKMELIGVFLIVVLYVGIAIFLDRTYFGYEYPSIGSHIDKRFTRVISYVVTAAGYAYFLFYKRRQEILSRAKSVRIKNLELHNQRIKNSFEELLETQSFN